MSDPRPLVFVVEDDEEMRNLLDEELREAGYAVRTAANGVEALELFDESPADVVVTDLMMPGPKGNELLQEIHARDPDVPVVITTAFGSIESAVTAIQAGAFHYVAKPFRMEQLLVTVANAVRERSLRQEVARLREAAGHAESRIVATSRPMRRALELSSRAAGVDTPVLLLGESGTGKELLARDLHSRSPRRQRRFTAVNCSAIPDQLLESQLFGHRRGAFTDAHEDRKGLFQETEGGTILLDEIGDMPPGLQAKLLRVLQEKEVHPLGAPEPVRVDVRVVAATHRKLEALILEGRFREDLFYRLNVIAIPVPPLRDRPEDLVPLIAHFLEKHARRLGRPGCTLSSDALALLHGYGWPGNVRELENAIERALVLGHETVIGPDDLPETLRGRAGVSASVAPGVRPMVEVEREHILRAMQASGGNKSVAARLLGLDRKTLYRKLEQFGIR